MKITLRSREARPTAIYLMWQKTIRRQRHTVQKTISQTLLLCSLLLFAAIADAQLQFTSAPVTSTPEKTAYRYQLSANDPGNSHLTFSAPTLPSWLTLNTASDVPTILAEGYASNATAIDEDNNIYFADSYSNVIFKVTPDGTISNFAFRNQYESYGMLVHGDFLYVGNWNGCSNANSITRFHLDDPIAGEEVVLGSGGAGAAGMNMTVNNGYLYYAAFGCDKIGRVNLSTFIAEEYIADVPGCWGLAFAPNGDLYVSKYFTNGVYKFAAGTTSNPVDVMTNIAAFNIIADGDGSLFVSVAFGGIRKYSPDLLTHVQVSDGDLIYSMSLNSSKVLAYTDAGTSNISSISLGTNLSGTPTHANVGNHPVRLAVTNGIETVYQDFVITVTDPNPPIVIQYTPAQNSEEIAVDTVARLHFDETITKGTGYISVKSVLTDAVLQTIDITGSDVSITDSILGINLQNLPANTEIYITIDAGAVKDLSGNDFAGINDYYTWSFTTIGKESQTITFNTSNEVIYGTADYAPGAITTSGLAISYTSSNTDVATIISGKIHIRKAGITIITATQAGNTTFSAATPVAQQLTIIPKQLTLSILASPAITKTYDGTTNVNISTANFKLTGVITGDVVSATGTSHFNDKNAGSGKTITSGTFVLSGSAAGNYIVSNVSATVSGSISAKSLFVSLKANPLITKIYDGTDSAALQPANFLITGILGADEVFVTAEAHYNNKHAGTPKPVQATNFIFRGASAANYAVATVAAGTTGEIKKRNITITAHPKSKMYGTNDPVFTFDITGLVPDDVLSGQLERETNKNVGHYEITVGTLSAGDNYNLTSYTSAELTITRANLMLKAEDLTKQQGKSNPTLTIRYSGMAPGDSPSDLLTIPKTYTNAVANSPIGYYDIVIAGAGSPNYNISYVNGKLTVVPGDNTHLKAWQSSKSLIQIRIYSEILQKTTLSLFNYAGQPVITQQQQLQPGINSYTLPLGSVANGVYILKASAENFTETQKVPVN